MLQAGHNYLLVGMAYKPAGEKYHGVLQGGALGPPPKDLALYCPVVSDVNGDDQADGERSLKQGMKKQLLSRLKQKTVPSCNEIYVLI